ncbi:MAG TPA: hypothetical protein EYM55_04110, partial [Candidatus Marinimicrobia bacterium]|nr:hypothetical protein [Candidatus Neomarinimicrobiota bacterium]
KLIGPEHVGLGSDFDGVSVLPKGVEDCTKLPVITEKLLERGYSEVDIRKILGGNFKRIFEEAVGLHKLLFYQYLIRSGISG